MQIHKLLFVLAASTLLLLSTGAALHNESVGEIIFEHYDNELYARATLDKRYLVAALKQNATCPAATMMSKCAPEYLTNHFGIRVNNQRVNMEPIQHELTQHHFVVTYKVDAKPAPIKTVGINSTYMLGLDGHATLNVAFNMADKPKHYTLSSRRTSINVEFE